MEPTSEKEKTNFRTLQACQRCRSLKARCLPSAQEGTCQRCFKSKRECAWTSNPPKIFKARGPSRISQVERKIDGLLERITEHSAPARPSLAGPGTGEQQVTDVVERRPQQQDVSSSDTSPIGLPDRSCESPRHDVDEPMKRLEGIAKLHQFGAANSGALDYSDAPIVKQDPKSDEILAKTYLETTEAEGLLEEYKHMFPSSPFVPVSATTTAQDLRLQKPLLLLAIMTVASWRNRKLQAPLEKQLRNEIAYRAIMKPRKDIVLIQSIIVYLSWCHQLLDHGMHDMSTFLHLSIGVANDLRVDPRARPEISPRKVKAVASSCSRQEEQRTLLGCYHMSSMIANAYRNPNFFKCSRYISECSELLQRGEEFDSDKNMMLLIRMRRVEDQMFDQYCSTEVFSYYFTDDQITAQIEPWELQLRELQREVESADNSGMLCFTLHAMKMELYTEAIHRVFNADVSHSPDNLVSQTTRIHLVSSCLEAGKAFLDALIATSAEDYHLISMNEWMRLPRVIMVLIMIATKMTNERVGWDMKAAQDRIRLDLYLESLCFRMQNLTTFKSPEQPRPDFWMAVKTVMQSIRAWYKQSVTATGPTSSKAHSTSSRASHCPVYNTTTTNSYTPHSTGVGSTRSRSTGVPPQTPTGMVEGGDPTSIPYVFSPGQTYDHVAPWMPPYADVPAGVDQFMSLDYWQGACPFDSMNFEF